MSERLPAGQEPVLWSQSSAWISMSPLYTWQAPTFAVSLLPTTRGRMIAASNPRIAVTASNSSNENARWWSLSITFAVAPLSLAWLMGQCPTVFTMSNIGR